MSNIQTFVPASKLLSKRLASAVAILSISCLMIGSPLSYAEKSASLSKAQSSKVLLSKVSINKSDVAALSANLVGVGEKKAHAIVQWRKTHGKFKSIDDLAQVKGIGKSILEKNRDRLTL